jgi:hypothetical protein
MAVVLSALKQMRDVLKAYDTYAKASSAALNIHKTEIIGALDTNDCLEYLSGNLEKKTGGIVVSITDVGF